MFNLGGWGDGGGLTGCVAFIGWFFMLFALPGIIVSTIGLILGLKSYKIERKTLTKVGIGLNAGAYGIIVLFGLILKM